MASDATITETTLAALQSPNGITGTDGADQLAGTSGTDIIDGAAGDDTLEGFSGRDLLSGGDGSDRISGGAGSDIMRGDAGADTFILDTSQFGGGNDIIRDFSAAEDSIEFETGNLLSANPQAGQPDPATPDPAFQSVVLASLDDSDNFSITQSAEGFVTINTPSGPTEIQGLPFSASSDSFAENADIFTIADVRPEGSQILGGLADTEENISGGIGDDVLFGGAGADNFLFNPNVAEGGNDIVADFNPQEDTLAVEAANLEAADPTLAGVAGDPAVVELADLDASDSFFLSPAEDGSLAIGGPNGTVTLRGVPFDTNTENFSDLGFFDLRNTIDQPTPEQDAINGFIEATTPAAGATGTMETAGTDTAAGTTAADIGATGTTADTSIIGGPFTPGTQDMLAPTDTTGPVI